MVRELKRDPRVSAIIKRNLLIIVEFCQLVVYGVIVLWEKLLSWVTPPTPKCLEKEVILITGSAAGLGRTVGIELVKQGAKKLVLWDIATNENEKTAQELRDLGAEVVLADTVDIADRQKIFTAAQKVRKEIGNVTILINNAGVAAPERFLKLKPADIQRVLDVNIISHFWTIQEFLPLMVENNHGHIVSICSTSGHMSIRGSAPYNASKHAVHGMVECLKDEVEHLPIPHDNVKFTTVYPWFFKTRMVENMKWSFTLRFPNLTPYMKASYVAEGVVNGIRRNRDYVYIPNQFRIFLAFQYWVPIKLQHACEDFALEDEFYDDESIYLPAYKKIMGHKYNGDEGRRKQNGYSYDKQRTGHNGNVVTNGDFVHNTILNKNL